MPEIVMYLAVVAIIVAGAVGSTAHFVQARVSQVDAHRLAAAVSGGNASLIQGLATQIAGGATAVQLPGPQTEIVCDQSPCSQTAQVAYSLAGGTAPANQTQASASQQAINLLQNVQEQRLAVNETATLLDGGKVTASRSWLATVRLTQAPPYAELVSNTDATGAANSPTSGDYGGCDPANPSGTCDQEAAQAPDHTFLDMATVCNDTPTTGCAVETPPPAVYTSPSYNDANDVVGPLGR